MPDYHRDRLITIHASESEVSPAFESFAKWSPWQGMRRDAKPDYHGTPGQVGNGDWWKAAITGVLRTKLVAFTSLILVASLTPWSLATELQDLPTLDNSNSSSVQQDYLVHAIEREAAAYRSRDGRELILDNGLIRRTWRMEPNGACVGYDNLMNGQAMLRSVRPEARITIDGSSFDVGGLVGQPNHAYIKAQWLDQMQADPQAMQLVGFELGKPAPRFAWIRRRHAAPNAKWPPEGVYLRMDYSLSQANEGNSTAREIRVSVHYELYSGVPVMSKWLTVHNGSDRELVVDEFTCEELALVEHSTWVEKREGSDIPKPSCLHVETNFAFGGFVHQNANRHVVHWRTDPSYTSQVNYRLQTPCLLVVEPSYGPAQRVEPGDSFESFRVFELAQGDDDRERRSLGLRRMYRTIAPWVTENPITHHLLSNDSQRVREAIDQAAAVGFEAIILSFGSGFNMENQDAQFLNEWKQVADYAEQKQIELGCYSLFSSRNVGKDHMIVSPEGQTPAHGQCPAVTSAWGQDWLKTIQGFYASTGFDQFENDGPYPGDIDITARPPLQQGIEDSRWVQWQLTAKLYHQLREKGVYINAPDFYYLNGSNKCGMGYREVNWSLPRAQQVIHTRQNIYDGSWTKTPSMGWMHVPLSQYHGGGAAATIEPLREHLDHYRQMLRSNLGMGVQAHYRGPRLFDAPETREMVKSQVDWFKKYRDILESDIIHGRRADAREVDWVLHVNPQLENRGMLCVYNPLDHDVRKTLLVNLYYTGLTDVAVIRHEGQLPTEFRLARDYSVDIPVEVPAGAMTWYVIQSNGK